MKTPSQDLFHFIHSMSSSEKRYFKKDTRDSNTLDLFDIINDMDMYNEEEVKNRLKDSSYAGNLKVHKNRLQQILLKNLRSFYEEKTAHSKIKVLIDNSEIFLRKKLYDLALVQLDKAIHYCENYEEFELKLQALGIKSRMASYFSELSTMENSPILEMEYCARQIQNYVQHAIVNKTILTLLEQNSDSQTSLELLDIIQKTIHREIVEKKQFPISSIAERMYYHSMAMMYDVGGDLEKACNLTAKIVENFESNPYIVEEKNAQYFNTLVNFLDFFSKKKNALKEVESVVIKAEKHTLIYEYLRPNMVYIYLPYVISLRAEGEFYKVTELLGQKIFNLIEKHKLADHFIVLKTIANTLEALIALSDFDKAAKVFKFINPRKDDLPKNLSAAITLIEILYHYDKMDFIFIEHLATSMLKKIKKSDYNSRFLETFFNLSRRLSNTNIVEHKNIFQLYRNSVASFHEDPIFKNLSVLISLEIWLDSHIKGIPYIELRKLAD